MTWRKREIMDEIHSCSYYCERPECIKAQRDDLRDKITQPEQTEVQRLIALVRAQQITIDKLEMALAQPEQEPVQVSPLEFVTMVMEKEHLIGKPIFWAQWPNKEKNT